MHGSAVPVRCAVAGQHVCAWLCAVPHAASRDKAQTAPHAVMEQPARTRLSYWHHFTHTQGSSRHAHGSATHHEETLGLADDAGPHGAVASLLDGARAEQLGGAHGLGSPLEHHGASRVERREQLRAAEPAGGLPYEGATGVSKAQQRTCVRQVVIRPFRLRTGMPGTLGCKAAAVGAELCGSRR